MKQTIAFAVDTYLPQTHTWIYNQVRFIRNRHILILAEMLNYERIHFPLEEHELFSFPGFKALENPNIPQRVFRKLWRLILADSRLDLLVFTRKAKIYDCSLIHAHFAHIGWKFIPVAKKLGVPIVVSFYGYDYDYLPNIEPKWKSRYQELFKYGSLFLTEGKYGCERLIEKGVSPSRVKINHLGVDIDAIPFKVRNLAQGEVLRLVQVASFVEKKGHRRLIEAMRRLKEKGIIENVFLTLIGDGPEKQRIINLAERYHLKKYINFINHLPYRCLHQELLKYHVFIHPSLTTSIGDCEGGAPVVLLDAQATGMPVISTYHCDIPEEVIHNKTGLLVPEANHKALADAILKFLNNPRLIAKYGTAGRKHMNENYSAKRQAESLNIIYSELINE